MVKFIIGAWLITTVAVAQNTPKTPMTANEKPAKNMGRNVSAATKSGAGSGSGNRTTKPGSKTVSSKPIPKPALSDKTESGNALNPNYNKQKAEGRGAKPKFPSQEADAKAPRKTGNQR